MPFRWLSSLFRTKADPPRAGGGDVMDIVTTRSSRPPTVRELFAELRVCSISPMPRAWACDP